MAIGTEARHGNANRRRFRCPRPCRAPRLRRLALSLSPSRFPSVSCSKFCVIDPCAHESHGSWDSSAAKSLTVKVGPQSFERGKAAELTTEGDRWTLAAEEGALRLYPNASPIYVRQLR